MTARKNAMRLRFTGLVIPVLAACAVAAPIRAQTGAATRLVGRILDQENARPVGGVLIRFDSATTALSDDRGWFIFDGVAAGSHRLSVEMIGYAARADTLDVRAGQVNEVRLTIAKTAISLEPIEVTVRSGWLESSGFYEREESSAAGHFVNRADIERKQPHVLTDLLSDIPGLRVHFLDAGRKHVRITRGGTSNLQAFDPRQELVLPGCEPDLYLDGQLYRERIPRDATENKVDAFDIVEPQLIEGIEVYTGSTSPLQYQNSCGVILVWTKRGNAAGQTARPTPAPSTAPAASRGEPPAVESGAAVRVTRRFGGILEGTLAAATPDSVMVSKKGVTTPFALSQLRKLEQDGGVATTGERGLRGAKWGFMLSVAAIAITAAVQEFKEVQTGRDIKITNTSPRKPAFAVKVIGASSIGGALLGSAFWRYHRWIEVPIR
jgi:Carboxypeptidase regulatory-like domain/TonB-dependent Receptor Plug Domain